MKIFFRTNLDLLPCEHWPEELPVVPQVGDKVESSHEWKEDDTSTGVHLSLVICRVRWVVKANKNPQYIPNTWNPEFLKSWHPEVELTVPKRFESLRTFFEWYGRITGKGVHYFI